MEVGSGLEDWVLVCERYRAGVTACRTGAFVRSACAGTNLGVQRGRSPLPDFLSPISFGGRKRKGPAGGIPTRQAARGPRLFYILRAGNEFRPRAGAKAPSRLRRVPWKKWARRRQPLRQRKRREAYSDIFRLGCPFFRLSNVVFWYHQRIVSSDRTERLPSCFLLLSYREEFLCSRICSPSFLLIRPVIM
jgi:hypothetical protein